MPSIENSFSHTRGEFNGRFQGSPGLAVNGSPWLSRVTRAPVMPLKSAKGSTSTPTPTAPQVARQFVRNPKKMSRRGAIQRTANAAILVLRTTGLPPRCLVVERICDPRATFHSVYERIRLDANIRPGRGILLSFRMPRWDGRRTSSTTRANTNHSKTRPCRVCQPLSDFELSGARPLAVCRRVGGVGFSCTCPQLPGSIGTRLCLHLE